MRALHLAVEAPNSSTVQPHPSSVVPTTMYGATAVSPLEDDEAPGMEVRASRLGFAAKQRFAWEMELREVSFAAAAGEVVFCVGAAGAWGRRGGGAPARGGSCDPGKKRDEGEHSSSLGWWSGLPVASRPAHALQARSSETR